MNPNEVINDVVIFTTPKVLQNCLELEFLFNDLFIGIRMSCDLTEAISARTIIYLEYDFDNSIAQTIKSSGIRLILMHLGDETAIKDLHTYLSADTILRNYYHQAIFEDSRWSEKIHWMPNGYRNGLRQSRSRRPKPVASRKQFARFIGWLSNSNSLNNERANFEQAAKSCENLLQCIPTQGFAGGFSPNLYKHLMEDTIFAPCPAGNAAETIRIFDALECGCIPISLQHSFLEKQTALQNHPFVILQEWNLLPNTFRELFDLRSKLEELTTMQNRSTKYWNSTKVLARAIVKRSLA